MFVSFLKRPSELTEVAEAAQRGAVETDGPMGGNVTRGWEG